MGNWLCPGMYSFIQLSESGIQPVNHKHNICLQTHIIHTQNMHAKIETSYDKDNK